MPNCPLMPPYDPSPAVPTKEQELCLLEEELNYVVAANACNGSYPCCTIADDNYTAAAEACMGIS